MTTVTPEPQVPGDRTFPALNALRAAGAIMVLSTHVAFDTGRILEGWTGAVLARFDFGVALFFVLSGFLLSRPIFLARALGRPQPSTAHYFWKRALRIVPLYWVVVLAAMTLEPANRNVPWSTWVEQFTFTQLYSPGLLPVGLTQMWSLATEVAFYVLLPLLALALLWRPRPAGLAVTDVLLRLAVVAALGVAWQTNVAQIPGYQGHYAQWLPGYLPWFCAGMAFAVVSASLRADPRPHVLERVGADTAGCWILATAVFALACTPLAGPRTLAQPSGWDAFFKCVLYAIAAGLYVLPFVFGPERTGAIRNAASARVPVFLGEVSFGIFCVHVLVLKAVFRRLDLDVFAGRFETVWLGTAGMALVLATVSFYWLERPALRLKNKGPFARARKERQSAPTTST